MTKAVPNLPKAQTNETPGEALREFTFKELGKVLLQRQCYDIIEQLGTGNFDYEREKIRRFYKSALDFLLDFGVISLDEDKRFIFGELGGKIFDNLPDKEDLEHLASDSLNVGWGGLRCLLWTKQGVVSNLTYNAIADTGDWHSYYINLPNPLFNNGYIKRSKKRFILNKDRAERAERLVTKISAIEDAIGYDQRLTLNAEQVARIKMLDEKAEDEPDILVKEIFYDKTDPDDTFYHTGSGRRVNLSNEHSIIITCRKDEIARLAAQKVIELRKLCLKEDIQCYCITSRLMLDKDKVSYSVTICGPISIG